MSDIHYFQRYSQKENVITNNTLRLFGQLYNDSPDRLQDLLEGLVDGVSVDLGVDMEQQTKGSGSIPDGSLKQSSFRLVLETKRTASCSLRQLKRHLEAFDGEEQRILLLLCPVSPDDTNEIEAAAKEDGTMFAAVTFADIIDLLIGEEALISEYEKDLRHLVDDYQSFCSEEGLLPSDDVLRAVPCGTSHEHNFKFDLYYAPASRGYRTHQYLGIYYGKSIRGIGKLSRIVDVDRVNGQLEGEGVEELTEDERQRIREAMDAASDLYYSIERDHTFFLVDEFHETDYTKVSKYGMQGTRYFSLRDVLGIGDTNDLPPTEEITRRLSELSWT